MVGSDQIIIDEVEVGVHLMRNKTEEIFQDVFVREVNRLIYAKQYFNFDSPSQKRFLRSISRKRLTIEVSTLDELMVLSIDAPLVS